MSRPETSGGELLRSCSWCHKLNAAEVKYCERCGHEAHVARCHCKCATCRMDRVARAAAIGLESTRPRPRGWRR